MCQPYLYLMDIKSYGKKHIFSTFVKLNDFSVMFPHGLSVSKCQYVEKYIFYLFSFFIPKRHLL
jgi:hypothetical protein